MSVRAPRASALSAGLGTGDFGQEPPDVREYQVDSEEALKMVEAWQRDEGGRRAASVGDAPSAAR